MYIYIWYVCRPSNQNCNNTSIFDSYERFDIHLIEQPEPNITCINCDRSIHPVQIFDFNKEVNADDSELDDDEVDKIDVNDIEGTLACNLTDYVPIQRS